MQNRYEFPEFEQSPEDLPRFDPADLDQVDVTYLFPARRSIKKGTEFLLDISYEESLDAREILKNIGESYKDFLHFCVTQRELLEAFRQPGLVDGAFLYGTAIQVIMGRILSFYEDSRVRLIRRARELTDLITNTPEGWGSWIVGIPFDISANPVAARLNAITVVRNEETFHLEPVVQDQYSMQLGLLPDDFFYDATLYSHHVGRSL